MATNDWRTLLHQFATGAISRRTFVSSALAFGASAGAISKAMADSACGPCDDVHAEAVALQASTPTAGGPLLPADWVGPVNSAKEPLTAEKVTLKIVVPEHIEVGDWATNTFTQWYEERTNVHIEWQSVAGTTDEKRAAVNAMIAGGDLPDIFMALNFTPAQLQLYGAQGLFTPLNDLIDSQGFEIKRVFEQYPSVRDTITANDGNIYTMPDVNDCYHCKGSSKLWINKTWLDKLGLGIPQTTDEFHAALKAFKDQDPNGNGQADEVPMSASTDGWAGATGTNAPTGFGPYDPYFMGSFLYNPGEPWLVLTEGKVDVSFNKPGWREGLKYLNALYNDGLIARESFSQTADQLKQTGDHEGDNILGASPAGYWGVFLTIDQNTAGARWEEYVTVPPLQGPDGTRIATWNHFGGVNVGQFVVTSACKNPELAVKWADGLYELEAVIRAYAGNLDQDWRWATEGEMGINGKQGIWKALVTWSSDAMRGHWWGQQSIMYRSSDLRLGEVVDPAHPTFESPLYRATVDNYFPYAEDQSLEVPLLYLSEEQANQAGELGVTITGYVKQSFAEFVLGDRDANDDGAWNDYLDTLNQMALENYLGVYQAAYEAKYGAA